MQNNEEVLKSASAFPGTFGLRRFPGLKFRIDLDKSFLAHSGKVTLYTQIRRQGQWFDFAAGSPEEIKAEVVEPDVI